MTEFITKEEAKALIEVAYKAAFEDVSNTGAGAIALQNAINEYIAQKFELWGKCPYGTERDLYALKGASK